MIKQNGRKKRLQVSSVVLLLLAAMICYMLLFPNQKTMDRIIDDESIEINRGSLKEIINEEDDFRLYAAVSGKDHTEIRFISVKDHDFEKMERLPQGNGVLDWVYSFNFDDRSKNILFGRINTNDYGTLEIKGVQNSEIHFFTIQHQTCFWAEAKIDLPVDIVLYDSSGKVIYSNMNGMGTGG